MEREGEGANGQQRKPRKMAVGGEGDRIFVLRAEIDIEHSV